MGRHLHWLHDLANSNKWRHLHCHIALDCHIGFISWYRVGIFISQGHNNIVTQQESVSYILTHNRTPGFHGFDIKIKGKVWRWGGIISLRKLCGVFSGDEDVLYVWRWGQLKSSEGAESLRHPQHSLQQLTVPPHKITPKLLTGPIPIIISSILFFLPN